MCVVYLLFSTIIFTQLSSSRDGSAQHTPQTHNPRQQPSSIHVSHHRVFLEKHRVKNKIRRHVATSVCLVCQLLAAPSYQIRCRRLFKTLKCLNSFCHAALQNGLTVCAVAVGATQNPCCEFVSHRLRRFTQSVV